MQGVVVTTTGTLARERQTALLIATDKTSGRVLRCEIFVDHIHKLQIETKTRTLYRDDVQDVNIQAFDSDGNVFSTLEGLSFRWAMVPLNPRQTNVMKFLPFRDVSVDAPASVYLLEESGKQASQVLVQAMDVGRVNLSAVLEDGQAEGLNSKKNITIKKKKKKKKQKKKKKKKEQFSFFSFIHFIYVLQVLHCQIASFFPFIILLFWSLLGLSMFWLAHRFNTFCRRRARLVFLC